MRTTMTLLLLAAALSAQAIPVAFTTADYETFAFAEAGSTLDGPNSDGPGAPLLITSADAVDGDNFAAATGLADALFLAATTEVNAADAPASAVANASFTGMFSGFGAYSLSVNFENLVLGDLNVAEAVLVVTLDASGVTLLDQILTITDTIDFEFVLPAGALGLLDLTLISTAAAELGNGFNLASASFDLQRVPEPATAALLMLGVALGASRGRVAART